MSGKPENNNDFAGRELAISRLLNAPIELVWEVWTKPEHIKNWWGPNGFTNTISKMEVKNGGLWELIMHGPDGTDYPNLSRFKEIVKHERIVYEHISKPTFLTTVTFTAEGKKTHIHWHMLFETKEEFERVVKTFKADKGLEQNFEKMEVYLSGQQQPPLIIERTYNAPIQLVWKALSDNNEMKKWYFPFSDFKPELGFKFRFEKVKGDRIYLHLFEVTEVIPGKKLTYSWQYDGYTGISFVTFELFAEVEKTRLKLTHAGLDTFPQNNPDLLWHNFEAGWTHILGVSLKEFVEKAGI